MSKNVIKFILCWPSPRHILKRDLHTCRDSGEKPKLDAVYGSERRIVSTSLRTGTPIWFRLVQVLRMLPWSF